MPCGVVAGKADNDAMKNSGRCADSVNLAGDLVTVPLKRSRESLRHPAEECALEGSERSLKGSRGIRLAALLSALRQTLRIIPATP